MSKFSRSVQKSGTIDRLEARVEELELLSVRQLVMLACYEVQAGVIDHKLVQGTNEMLQGKEFKTHGQLYTTAFGCARSVWAELEFEAASRELSLKKKLETQRAEDALMFQQEESAGPYYTPEVVESTQDMSPTPAAKTQLSVPDSTGNAED